MSKVRILGARLSSNPQTATVQHPQGINGVVNATTNGKLFYVADAVIMKGMNPIKKSTSIWANEQSQFAFSMEEYNAYNKDTVVEGQLQRFEDVPPYTVPDSAGVLRTYTHVELLVLEGENPNTVVGNWIKRQQQGNAAAGIVNNNAQALELNLTNTSALPDEEAAKLAAEEAAAKLAEEAAKALAGG